MPEPRLSNIIAKWRSQRLKLQKSIRTTLSSTKQGVADNNLDPALQSLCTELIDYVSTGHFSVYSHHYSFAASKRSEHADTLQNIYQYIGNTTDQVLLFNDCIDTIQYSKPSNTLYLELKKLHKALSVRFALEEQLLELGSTESRRAKAFDLRPG